MIFPEIKHIDDILPHIKENDNFSVNRKDDYIVIDYILNTPDLFKNSIEKECRGIIFDAESGKLLRRPLHKFFNLNERPESLIENIDFSHKHWILEKLDGSMIVPFFNSEGRLIWGSKAGETFLTPQILEFAREHPQYDEFARTAISQGMTPIFEWCTRKNRIVIDHPKDRLVLIAIRDNNFSGMYLEYDRLVNLAEYYNIEVVEQFEGTVQNMQQLSDQIKDMKGLEGYVVAFEDGFRVKIKADEYCRHHKAKDTLNLEKNVVGVIVNGQGDDFYQLLHDRDRVRFITFEHAFLNEIRGVAYKTYFNLKSFLKDGMTKKKFALEYQADVPSLLRRVYFKYLETNVKLDKGMVYEDIINMAKGMVGRQADVDQFKSLFKYNINWIDWTDTTVY